MNEKEKNEMYYQMYYQCMVNGDLYQCIVEEPNNTAAISEMEKRGYKNIDNFGALTAAGNFGNYSSYQDYLDPLKPSPEPQKLSDITPNDEQPTAAIPTGDLKKLIQGFEILEKYRPANQNHVCVCCEDGLFVGNVDWDISKEDLIYLERLGFYEDEDSFKVII